MSEIPSDLKYSKSHEWTRDEGGVITIGITDHAQELLGDIVFVELPEVGAEVGTEDECGVIESVKAASDLYAPVAGEIVAVNEELVDAPEQINEAPYEAWIFKLKPSNPAEMDELLDAAAYTEVVESE
ncbi:MAG: glycine cleavage system protein GcvH [Gammaproteobacteria bacterium]|jgi:glycine cleavage system H protein|nr:glycine cleavage system protein GcvH [Gammaproteobacteria bacterium]MBT4811670.1 glycine cleavage system protein GcvH [Thiotrichales bacterium]MBT4079302.1 glycine cleavage system protein GcvH [Gammaproteobacteria bacterium]MBT5362120.1 glycine cleavage system protein GcvH [Gammaproteobacteria bacterium]MBT5636429.1 glycine cleavage system protein GcvH [Gammaproteobacteria bacterium]